ncbi:MAG TPA: inositol monophosphatase family protein [Planctomycetota bacterium]|nr:inositol monophosphatase family protein [Planctomycetota bacterium]
MTPTLPGRGDPEGPSRELAAAIAAARAAGEVALRHLGSSRFELKSDHSIVTAADVECEDTVRSVLAPLGIPVIGEERSDEAAVAGLASLERAWVVDPIDGTASFAVALPGFGVEIGLLERGVPVLGVFYQPWTDELYAADRTGTGTWGRQAVRGALTPETLDERAFFCSPSDAHHHHMIRFPGKVRALGSTALHVALVARGAAIGALISPHVWDVAGVAPLLERAGGAFFRLDSGEKVDFAAWVQEGAPERDLLVCAPESLPPLRQFVSRRP